MKIMTMANRLHRIAFAAAAALGDGCSAFRRTETSVPLFVPHFVSPGAADVSNRHPTPPSQCRSYEQRHAHWRWSRMPISTPGRSGKALQFSDTTYDSEDIDDESNCRANDPPMEKNTGPSLLLKALTKSIQSALKNISKKTTSLQRELTKAQSLEETTHRANLIVSNLYRLPSGTTSAEVEDWDNDGQIVELMLNTKEYSSAQDESDALFALARKMKRGSKVVEELMSKSVAAEQILNDALQDLGPMAEKEDEGTVAFIQERLERTAKETGFKSPNLQLNAQAESPSNRSKSKRTSDKTQNKPNPRQMTSPSGIRVLVGRNRRDNEALCFKLSKPTDIWMHSRGCPGAHVLLCYRTGGPEVADEDLQFAANLAAFYSDARTETRAEIGTAEIKHITKPRGAPLGAVTLRQEGKTLVGRPGDVAEDLKEAREKSGAAWDEMGYQKLGTRAKNKKKTASLDKAKKAQKREDAKGKSKRQKRKEEQGNWY